MFRNGIVKLGYYGYELSDVLTHLGDPLSETERSDMYNYLGQPLSDEEQREHDYIYIGKCNTDLFLLSIEEFQKTIVDDDTQIFRLSRDNYNKLTNKKSKSPVKLTPMVSDSLAERLAYAFATDVVLLGALFTTFWFLPVASLVFAPVIFFGSTMVLSLARFKQSFGRWPDQAEVSSMIKYAFDATITVLIPAAIYLILTGASLFAPVILNTISIGTLTLGGPLVTYFIAPLLMATTLAASVTIYKAAKQIFNHFFDFNFHRHNSFPYFFSISIRKNRPKLSTLLSELVKKSAAEFALNFMIVLTTVYLAYIPAGKLAGLIFGPGSAPSSILATVTNILFNAALGIGGALGFTYASEKSIAFFSKMSKGLRRIFSITSKRSHAYSELSRMNHETDEKSTPNNHKVSDTNPSSSTRIALMSLDMKHRTQTSENNKPPQREHVIQPTKESTLKQKLLMLNSDKPTEEPKAEKPSTQITTRR